MSVYVNKSSFIEGFRAMPTTRVANNWPRPCAHPPTATIAMAQPSTDTPALRFVSGSPSPLTAAMDLVLFTYRCKCGRRLPPRPGGIPVGHLAIGNSGTWQSVPRLPGAAPSAPQRAFHPNHSARPIPFRSTSDITPVGILVSLRAYNASKDGHSETSNSAFKCVACRE